MLCYWMYFKISILFMTSSRIPLNHEIVCTLFAITKYDEIFKAISGSQDQ
jgi:hypothetical protein